MAKIIKYILGPRLLKIYHATAENVYKPGALEKYSDQLIHSVNIMCKIGLWTSPVVAAELYRRGYYSVEGAITIVKFVTVVGVLVLSALVVRGLGRALTPQYSQFLSVLDSPLAKENVREYDFEFWAWPVNFYWNETESDESKPRLYIEQPQRRQTVLQNIASFPCQILSYVIVHTFGRRLMYPGSVGMLQGAMSNFLLEGRTKLVKELQSRRYKLMARDGNMIDTMFVDRRRSGEHLNGKTLVICCEGNAGFYEIGIMNTPVEAGYSVLGWNHPGFGGSTGVPFPSQETNAIDVVMQFAINRLRFEPEEIILFGWSIGGFPATWAGMNYPNIKAMILDATFDDVLPLALPRMPVSWGPLIRRSIRGYLNMDNVAHLTKYPGPVLLVRRSQDEIITTRELEISTNRGNHLLMKLLQHRFPKIVNAETLPVLEEWLEDTSVRQMQLWSKYGVDEDLCTSLLVSYITDNSGSYPLMLGDELSLEMKVHMTLFLAHKYMVDYDSTHCSPLPVSHFRLPWEPMVDAGFVQVRAPDSSCQTNTKEC